MLEKNQKIIFYIIITILGIPLGIMVLGIVVTPFFEYIWNPIFASTNINAIWGWAFLISIPFIINNILNHSKK